MAIRNLYFILHLLLLIDLDILKQQGHSLDMRCITYSTDGQYIASGSDDGKVKVWNTTNGFCFVTFTDHSGPVTDIAWSHNSNALFTCSSDGTVRLFFVDIC